MAIYLFILTLVSFWQPSIRFNKPYLRWGNWRQLYSPANDYLSKIAPAPIRIVTIKKQCPSILQHV